MSALSNLSALKIALEIAQGNARGRAQLAGSLRATGYPFVALLAFSGARTRLVASSQGAAAPGQLAAALKRAADEHGASLVAEQAEHRERARPNWFRVRIRVKYTMACQDRLTHLAHHFNRTTMISSGTGGARSGQEEHTERAC